MNWYGMEWKCNVMEVVKRNFSKGKVQCYVGKRMDKSPNTNPIWSVTQWQCWPRTSHMRHGTYLTCTLYYNLTMCTTLHCLSFTTVHFFLNNQLLINASYFKRSTCSLPGLFKKTMTFEQSNLIISFVFYTILARVSTPNRHSKYSPSITPFLPETISRVIWPKKVFI